MQDKTVFVGAIVGAYQLGTPVNSRKLRSTRRAGLYMQQIGLDHLINLTSNGFNGSVKAGKAVVTTFHGTGPGLFEGFLDSYSTPSVPAADDNYTRTDLWRAWASEIGFKPSIFMLNMNSHGTASTEIFTARDVQDVTEATTDIKSITPTIKLVLPYVSPNSGVYGNFDTDFYWSTARQVALQQGGFGIDVPVGYFLNNSPAYRKVVIDMLRWALQNHLTVLVLLSPYSTNKVDCTATNTCQFSPDPHFMSSVKEIVHRVHKGGADPTIWAVVNYSEQVASPQPGTDDKMSSRYSPNTILAVASWIADNASTSPYPASAHGLETDGASQHIRGRLH